jgi:hypothetical protein
MLVFLFFKQNNQLKGYMFLPLNILFSNLSKSNLDLLSLAGVISIAEQLDYERAKDYFLTIQAVDGGTPPLSNHATVNISVTDSNDNAPIFNQASYSARIREDAQIGDKILQVKTRKTMFFFLFLS